MIKRSPALICVCVYACVYMCVFSKRNTRKTNQKLIEIIYKGDRRWEEGTRIEVKIIKIK